MGDVLPASSNRADSRFILLRLCLLGATFQMRFMWRFCRHSCWQARGI
jgi:hypothetical protein